ncbi:MAG: hypothetical protein KKA84_08930 [Bacteroidetes bacterium]|nr:hypothetical protein [Bacteroidota bacterium]
MTETLQNISFEFSVPAFIVIIFGLIAIFLSAVYYRFSIPPISRAVKLSLISLRSLSLFLIILLLFELVLLLSYSEEKAAVNYLFIDKSMSITATDSINRSNEINNLIEDLKSDSLYFETYIFGSNVSRTGIDSLQHIRYADNTTNFENVFNVLANTNSEIASVVIISDGIINAGKNPLYQTDNFNFPIFTVGVGDISVSEDIELAKVDFNEYMYLNKPTVIEVGVMNNRDNVTSTIIELIDNNKPVATQKVVLQKNTYSNFNLEYVPSTVRMKNLLVRIIGFNGENNIVNNAKSFMVNVLSDKHKIGFISSSPSPDYARMIDVISKNDKYDVIDYTWVTGDKNVKNRKLSELDHVDALILSGFPTRNTPDNIVRSVKQLLTKNNIPFLFQLTNLTDPIKLKLIDDLLPFKIKESNQERGRRAAHLRSSHALALNMGAAEEYAKLPPIHLSNWDIELRQNTLTLMDAKQNSASTPEPIIVTSTVPRKTVSIFGYNFWKWELRQDNQLFFNHFFNNIISWLITETDLERLKLSLNKNTFALGEEVIPSVRLFDQLLQPFSNAEVKITTSMKHEINEILLTNLGEGRYSGSINDLKPGRYQIKASAKSDLGTWSEDSVEIKVEAVSSEMLNNIMNIQLLSGLSQATQGKFYYIRDTKGLKNNLIENPQNKFYSSISEKRINPLFNYFYLWVLITLFSLEWLIRKRAGMN